MMKWSSLDDQQVGIYTGITGTASRGQQISAMCAIFRKTLTCESRVTEFIFNTLSMFVGAPRADNMSTAACITLQCIII